MRKQMTEQEIMDLGMKDLQLFNLAQRLLSLVEGDRIDQEVLFDKVQPTVVEMLMILSEGTYNISREDQLQREEMLARKFSFWFKRKGADDDEN